MGSIELLFFPNLEQTGNKIISVGTKKNLHLFINLQLEVSTQKRIPH